MSRKLVAILACRNGGSRLYAKPLQNLGSKKQITVIEYLIKSLKKFEIIEDIGLAISEKKENFIYKEIAKSNSLKFITGDDFDVLSRLIKCAKKLKATDVLRITTESPFPYLNNLKETWKKHLDNNYDATLLDNIIDGCGYEIIKLKALEKSHRYGQKKHKSEFCTLYIRENIHMFKINRVFPKKAYFRKDLRLTIDNPEDLIVCKKIYENFQRKKLNLEKIILYLDKNKKLKDLIAPYCDNGYSKMYKWVSR